ncbi:MAG: peptidoglycan DD-metalloendopeptidase family protein [Oleiphilaceae bacterium]|nr:peptidoglycan DD-metalloendopeptidase family protein [Oleiphilaceae bacterium]
MRSILMPEKFLKPASLLLVLLFVLAGCNTTDIYNDDAYNPPVYWGRHVVKSGETLYAIAWRYGRDYRELGNANGIAPPFNIEAGEVIRLDLRGKTPASAPKKSPPKVVTSAPSPRPSSPQKTANESPPKVEKAPEKAMPLSDQSQTVAGVDWRWPHIGPVIASFSSSGQVNKGIDIAGNAGDSVLAAASGNVVYAGSGLLGYGNLIILNHNEHYLSAYAHNRKILVSEGDDVKGGQPIAELGSSGTERNKLHFEVRKNGNPVDPVPYLPPR